MAMTELSPRAKELMRQASRGGGPTDQQRRALKRTVMGAVLAPAVAAAATTKFVLAGLLVGAIGAGGIAASVVFSSHARRSEPPAAEARVIGSSVEATPTAPVVSAAPSPEATPVPSKKPLAVEAPEASPSVRQQALPRSAPEIGTPPASEATGLALELQTLDRAVRAVDADHFDEGLVAARGFLRDYPASEFAIEARVVEVLALCGLSRIDEARSAAARLPPGASLNPAVRRLDDSCADQFVP
jgi:hypothetical protein